MHCFFMYVKLIMKHKSRFICTATFPPCALGSFLKKENRYHFFIFHANQRNNSRMWRWILNVKIVFIRYIYLSPTTQIRGVLWRKKTNFEESLTSRQLSSVCLKIIPHTCDMWIYTRNSSLSKNEKKPIKIKWGSITLHNSSRLRSLMYERYFVINKKPLSQNYESILMFFLSFHSLIDDSLSYWNKYKGRQVCYWKKPV